MSVGSHDVRARRSSLVLVACLAFALSRAGMAEEPRPHVVFLLGSDHDAAGFFAGAREYYRRSDPAAQIVDEVRTLATLREELNRRVGAQPWGRIVLVAHGTQWTGLVVPLFDARTPATLSALRSAHEHAEFPPLPPTVVDADTELVVESCGLGRRPDYLAALAALFAQDAAHTPRVSAAHDMVWFGAAQTSAAARRELPYRARMLRGAASAVRSAEVAAQLRSDLAVEIGGEAASTLVLPVHVRIAATVDPAAVPRSLEAYVHLMTAERIDLGGAGFAPETFTWKRDEHAPPAALELTGEATLVLAMQQVPDASSSMPPILEVRATSAAP
ncbi:MAG TPA: hypothetical protein VFB32_14345 [Rudaea sp.]|nr:hypothetical protein [Rudaea sp.]